MLLLQAKRIYRFYFFRRNYNEEKQDPLFVLNRFLSFHQRLPMNH